MKNKIAKYAFIPAVLGLTLVGAGTASAHGLFGGGMRNLTPDEVAVHHQTMFQEKAQLLGISADEMKEAWAQGKNLKQIAKEKGLSEAQLKTKMKDAHQQKMKAHLQALVDKGVITQAQADKRLQVMQDHMNKRVDKKGKVKFKSGFRF